MGHHVPAPTWEGCRAALSALLLCSSVPGDCRSSDWALVLLAVVLLALVLLAGLWVWGLFFVSRCVGPDPRTRFSAGISLHVLGLRISASEASRRRPPLVVNGVMVQMLGNCGSLGATILGGEIACLFRQPSPSGPADSFRTRDGCVVGSVRVGLVLYFQTGATLRRQSLRAVAAAVHAVAASCRGTSQQNIAFQMFLQLLTTRRHASRAVGAAVSQGNSLPWTCGFSSKVTSALPVHRGFVVDVGASRIARSRWRLFSIARSVTPSLYVIRQIAVLSKSLSRWQYHLRVAGATTSRSS